MFTASSPSRRQAGDAEGHGSALWRRAAARDRHVVLMPQVWRRPPGRLRGRHIRAADRLRDGRLPRAGFRADAGHCGQRRLAEAQGPGTIACSGIPCNYPAYQALTGVLRRRYLGSLSTGCSPAVRCSAIALDPLPSSEVSTNKAAQAYSARMVQHQGFSLYLVTQQV